MKTENRKAFTLVEMLIVIVIIGILMVALIPNLIGMQARTRDTARVATIGKIALGLESYSADNNGYYPAGEKNGGRDIVEFKNVNELKPLLADHSKVEAEDSAVGLNYDDEKANGCAPDLNEGYYAYAPTGVVGKKTTGYVVTVALEIQKKGNSASCVMGESKEPASIDDTAYGNATGLYSKSAGTRKRK